MGLLSKWGQLSAHRARAAGRSRRLPSDLVESRPFAWAALAALAIALHGLPARADGARAGLRGDIFTGGDFFSSDIELGNSPLPDQVPAPGALFGLRLAYAATPQLAVETEFKLTEPKLRRGADRVRVFGARAQLMAFLRTEGALLPFIVAGGGVETLVASADSVQPIDLDPAVVWGGGLVWNIDAGLGLRLDGRQVISAGRGADLAMSYEAHLGITFGLSRPSNRLVF